MFSGLQWGCIVLFVFFGGGAVGGSVLDGFIQEFIYRSNPNTPNICIPQGQDTESVMHHDSQLDAHKDGTYWEHPGVISRSTNR